MMGKPSSFRQQFPVLLPPGTGSLFLLGDPGSKRTLYFQKAAQEKNVFLHVLPYGLSEPFKSSDDFFSGDFFFRQQEKSPEGPDTLFHSLHSGAPVFCKIDPPTYDFPEEMKYRIDCMYTAAEQYSDWLLSLPKPSGQLHYLNTPEGILQLLDKYKCKQILMKKGLSVTPLLAGEVSSYEELKQIMKERRCYSVFVKPKLASGAAGILAYRYHPVTGQEQLFTSACVEGNHIINTKRISCYRDKQMIRSLFRHILPLGTIVERWIPKAEYHGCKYDLRVLFQFGKISFITVRQSDSPITNLHLNNRALSAPVPGILPSCLHLSDEQAADMETLCARAVSCFPGIRSAGIDILLEKGRGTPEIIEMNGQGDLLYQDIYGRNKIYLEQVEQYLKLFTPGT